MTKEEFNRVQWHKGMRAVTRMQGIELVMNVVDVDFASYKIGLKYMLTYISCDCEYVELIPDSIMAKDIIANNKSKDNRISLGVSFRISALMCLVLAICITVGIILSKFFVLWGIIMIELILFCVLILPVVALLVMMNDEWI